MENTRSLYLFFFFFQAEDGIRDYKVTGVQTCALPILDQYAHALGARLPDAALVDGDGGISAAVQAGRLPVLAPYHWLRAADPLPHSRSEERRVGKECRSRWSPDH